MSDCLIVVINRSRARFFTLEPVAFPELESGPRMTPRLEIENPDIKQAQELYADSKTGRGAAPLGGAVHGYDDKRDQHLDELRRRFAVKVLDRIRKFAKSEGAATVIVAASAPMRRFVYPDLDALKRGGYRVHKLSKNVIKFSPQKIHQHLAAEGFIPAQKRISI